VPSRPEKKPEPSSWVKPDSSPKSASPVNSHTTARKVRGIIETMPRTVAKRAPTRMPRYAGMKKARMPITAMTSVHHAIGVSIGVKPDSVSRPNRSAM
jgi:hypothetical protein